MRDKIFQALLVLCLVAIVFVSTAQTSQVYNWKNVAIKGGGYVPAFVYSRAEANLLYTRTDMGGAYRWNATKKVWVSLTDAFTSSNAMGILSLAADPNDANRVYMATGLYTQSWDPTGVFFYSKDKGNSWKSVNLPCKIGGNEAGRGTGERLQIDPNSSNILFLGSQKEGLFKSTDFGLTWTKVTSFPKINISFVEFDQSTGTKGQATPTIYVSTYDNFTANDVTTGSLYKSIDGGATWSYLAGQPAFVTPKTATAANTPIIANNMAFAGDNIYITFMNNLAPGGDNGMLFKYNKKTGVWTELLPVNRGTQGGYSGVSVHPTNPNIVLVSSLGLWWPTSDQLYITSDGGTTWSNVTKIAIWDNSKAPHSGRLHWVSDVQIDPFNGNNAICGTGDGLYMTTDLEKATSNQAITLTFECDSLEETVPLDLISPTSGVPLISGLGDIKGFSHANLDVSPANTFNGSSNTNSLDFAALNPNKIVRTHGGGKYASYSLDQGITWTTFPSVLTGITGLGEISISADGNTFVWAPAGATMSYSNDNGTTWTSCVGQPAGVAPISDRVNSSVFYAVEGSTGKIFKSTDGGKNFAATTGTLPVNSGNNARCVFGKEGDIWFATGANGLYHTTDGGATVNKISSVSYASRVAIGKAATATGYPCVFIYGTVAGINALFRSDDQGVTWKRINTINQVWSGAYSALEGDPRIYGRLYVGVSSGRGIMYGDIAADGTCLIPNLGNDFTICQTATSSLSSSISDLAYSYVWMKDGVVLPQTTKDIIINKAGTYRVYASKGTCPVIYDEIDVKSNLVNIENDSICPNKTATLTAIGTGTYNWYSAATAGTLLATGNVYTVSPTATTTYYVQDTKTTAYSLGLPTTTTTGDWTLGGSFDNNQNRSKIVVESPLWLKSIALNITGSGTKGVIRITNELGAVVISATGTNLPIGTQAIPFNYLLSPGTYYIDAVGTTGSVRFQSSKTGAIWSIPNYVTMTQLSGWAYGIFFDLKFEVGNACARTPVLAVVKTNCTPVTKTQTIALVKGWNLISTNVYPTDSSIETLFKNLDVQEIKTMDAFWRKGQNIPYNSLTKIESGKGYLVNMNVAGTLNIVGIPVETPNLGISTKTGWQLIGCPYQSKTVLSTLFNTTNTKMLKDFTGFWFPNGTLNSIQELETGKGYFLNK